MRCTLFPRTVVAGGELILGGLGWLLAGCTALLPTQYQPVAVTAQEPAEIFVMPAARQLAVINRFDAAQLTYTKEQKVEVFRAGAAEAVRAAVRQLQADSTFRLAPHDTLVHAAAGVAAPLPTATVQQLCRHWRARGLLALESFDASMRQDEVVKQEDSDGSTSKTAAYSLVVRTRWTLYDAQGKVLNQSTAEVARPYQQRAVLSGLLAAGPALAQAGAKVQELAGLAGTEYGQRYLPKQLTLERNYYTSRELETAAASLHRRDWVAAATPLKTLAASADAKLAAKAAYNLSVVYEAINDLDEALRWATQAEQKAPNDRHTRRVQELRQRQKATAEWETQRAAANIGQP